MPGLSAFDLLKGIAETYPAVKVVMLSTQDTEEYAINALSAGAAGFLPKKAVQSELVRAVKSVSNGEQYLSAELTKRNNVSELKLVTEHRTRPEELTARQFDVLGMIAKGYSTKEMAQDLKISVKTVETHRALLMERLGIHDVAGLVRYAIKVGLIKIDE
jgi:DNA-binding NarL/FixJ family response regulator